MLELITMSVLALCYIKASVGEKLEEKSEKEKERIRDLKIKVFCYAIRNGLLYDDVVKMIRDRKITIEDLNGK